MGSKVCIFSGIKINFSRTKNNFSGTKNYFSGTQKIILVPLRLILVSLKLFLVPLKLFLVPLISFLVALKLFLVPLKLFLVPLKIQTFEPNGTPYTYSTVIDIKTNGITKFDLRIKDVTWIAKCEDPDQIAPIQVRIVCSDLSVPTFRTLR